MRLSAVLSLSVLALLPVGCGDSTPEPEVAPGSCPAGQYCPPPAPLVSATAPAPTPTAATNSQATPIAATLATPIITSTAGDEVKGMQPEGGAFAGQFQEGQVLEQPINLAPGKCYAVVGVSLPGVQELDVQIAAQPVPQLPAATLAQDNQTGGIAILGGKGTCWKNAAPIAITGKVILKVTKGTGIAGAQIYVK
ncbi:MAG TPA: hypothetical protein VE093_25400 [Polyangiaceae bacterium]|jgi:hypothetical protein|nr:hypothetical protein [Polyangiaceae bacterium]